MRKVCKKCHTYKIVAVTLLDNDGKVTGYICNNCIKDKPLKYRKMMYTSKIVQKEGK